MSFIMRILVVLCTLSFVFISAADAQTKYVQELNNLEAKKAFTPLFQKLMSFEPFKRLPDQTAVTEIKETLDWLRLRGFINNDSARYTYAYSAWLWSAGIKDTASAMYILAAIKARSDGARCADKTSPRDQTRQYEQFLQGPITQFLQTQSKDVKEKVFKVATSRLEERLPLRQPDEWLCNGGMAFFDKYVKKHGKLDGKNVPGSVTVVVEDDSIKPDFVNVEIWQAERRKVTDSAINNLRKILFEPPSNSVTEAK
jgi:hypothetical protein